MDVNVHPTKQVVRFSEERAAREAVAAAVRTAIEWRPPSPTVHPPRGRTDLHPGPLLRDRRRARRRTSRSFAAEGRPALPAPPAQSLREARERLSEASRPLTEQHRDRSRRSARAYGELPERGALPQASPEELRVIGQLAAGYILVEEPESLWVVDQHVAHERAILDRLNDSDSPATVQSLLVPEVVELSPGEAELAAASLEELSVYGFEAEPFGPRSVRVTAVISTLADRDVAGAFKDALSADHGHGARPPPRGSHPGDHRLPLGREDGRQALPARDGGPDKGLAHQPPPSHLPARALHLLPHRPRRGRPQARPALDGVPLKGSLLGVLAVAAAATMWGTLGIFAKMLYAEGVSFEALVAFRAAVGWLAVLLFVLATGGARGLRVAGRDLAFLIPLGLVGIGAFYLLYFYTVRESTVGTAAILALQLAGLRGGAGVAVSRGDACAGQGGRAAA